MKAVVALVCAFVMTACASYPADLTRDSLSPRQLAALDNDEIELSWRQHEHPAAVAVLIHGLNLDPVAMLDIQQLLFDANMDVLNLSLTGHNNALDDEGRLLSFQEATFADWQSDIRRAVQEAGRRAARLDRPLYLVGFSLGGLLSADYLVQNAVHSGDDDAVTIDRMVLLAPAISLKWSSYLLYPLQVFPDLYLPSVAPGIYSANDYAPVSAYLALYEGVGRFNELAEQEPNRQALNIPTLVLMHPRDELVSEDGLRGFISEHRLTQWQYVEVDKSDDAGDVLAHLIVGPHSLGRDAWSAVSATMLDFLR